MGESIPINIFLCYNMPMKRLNEKELKKIHRFVKKQKLSPLLTLIAFALITVFSFVYINRDGQVVEGVVLAKCVDGDTAHFNVDGVLEKVRFIAIDTPEINKKDYYAQEAKEYTCNRLTEAEKIELKIDPLAKEPDKYGRMIAWIYVDGELLQRELVEEGYASVKYIYDDYLYVDELYHLETQAKNMKKGIWK